MRGFFLALTLFAVAYAVAAKPGEEEDLESGVEARAGLEFGHSASGGVGALQSAVGFGRNLVDRGLEKLKSGGGRFGVHGGYGRHIGLGAHGRHGLKHGLKHGHEYYGYGQEYGSGLGYGRGQGYGLGQEYGLGQGYGYGQEYGRGLGYGGGQGYGYGQEYGRGLGYGGGQGYGYGQEYGRGLGYGRGQEEYGRGLEYGHGQSGHLLGKHGGLGGHGGFGDNLALGLEGRMGSGLSAKAEVAEVDVESSGKSARSSGPGDKVELGFKAGEKKVEVAAKA